MQLIASVLLSLATSIVAQGDLASLLLSQSDLSTLLSMIHLAGVSSTLPAVSNITILAPTHSALETLDPSGATAQAASNGDVAAVTAVLSNHVLQGQYSSNATSDVPVFLQSLLKPNTSSSNATDFTKFIPNDAAFESIASVLSRVNQTVVQQVLAYHVIANNINFSPSLGNVTVPSMQGGDLTFTVAQDGSAWVNNAKLLVPIIIFYNGVAHVIDRSHLAANAPAATRVAYSGATSGTSPPFSSISYPLATASTTSAPAILTTAPAAATGPAASTTGSNGATGSTSRAAAATRGLSQALATAAAVVVDGGMFAINM